MKNVVIAGYARSPFTFAQKGALKEVRPDELAAEVVKGLVARTGVNADDIEDLILGCAFPEAEQGLNLARMVTFMAELPLSVAGVTVNRFCGSSMSAIHMAAGAIQMNAGEVFICAGVESMTRVPVLGYNPMPHPGLYERHRLREREHVAGARRRDVHCECVLRAEGGLYEARCGGEGHVRCHCGHEDCIDLVRGDVCSLEALEGGPG